MCGGYLPKFTRNWIFRNCALRGPMGREGALLWLVENAAYSPYEDTFQGHKAQLDVGQLAVSLRMLAKEWKWDLNKVRAFLSRLETNAVIHTQANREYTLITICNYRENFGKERTCERKPTHQETHILNIKETKQENITLSRTVAAATERAPDTGSDGLASLPTDRPDTVDAPAEQNHVIQVGVVQLDLYAATAAVGQRSEPTVEPASVAEPIPDAGLPLETATPSTHQPTAEQKPGAESATGKKAELDEAFARFWKAYPKRQGGNPKEAAKQKFIATIKAGTNPDVLIHAAERYYAEQNAQSNVGTQYVAQALTWLNQRRWKDYTGNIRTGEFGAQSSNTEPENAKPAWMTNPNAWHDPARPPTWHDAPRGTRCGIWLADGQGGWVKRQRRAAEVF